MATSLPPLSRTLDSDTLNELRNIMRSQSTKKTETVSGWSSLEVPVIASKPIVLEAKNFTEITKVENEPVIVEAVVEIQNNDQTLNQKESIQLLL